MEHRGVVEELYKNRCPRCGSETLELDTPMIDVGKKKQMRVSLRQCPKCQLLFYEAAA
jgi:ribosomal protein S27AE